MISNNEYQQACLRTADERPLHLPARPALLLECALGVAGEASEFAENVKKHFFHGHDLDLEKLKEELGDTLWYAAVAAHVLGFALDDVMAANIEKLKRRYPNGFSSERSINRETLPSPTEAHRSSC